jgi:hypothetical protein
MPCTQQCCAWFCSICPVSASVKPCRVASYGWQCFEPIFIFSALSGLLFFTTYTLLVLFWAEIYHQARSLPTSSLRPVFVVFNLIVYCVQVRNRRLLSLAGCATLSSLTLSHAFAGRPVGVHQLRKNRQVV